MQKILVFDNILNSQSISSCALKWPQLRFFGFRPDSTVEENVNGCNPDYIMVNEYFMSSDIIAELESKFGDKLRKYNINQIVPNVFVSPNVNPINETCAILFDNLETKLDTNKEFKYEDKYIRIYSLVNTTHPQMVGLLYSARDLFDVVNRYQTVLDASGGCLKGFCKFYGKNYGIFKPRGTISVIPPDQNNANIITNIEIMSKFYE